MSVVDPFLDPENIASKDFSSKRKGYDQEEVRAYLRRLAEATRQTSRGGDASDLQAQNDRLLSEIAEMREKLEELGANNDEEGVHVTNLITSETTMVIDAARAAAAEILRKAEAESARRRRELNELEQRVEAEVSEKRTNVAEEAARIRREVKTEVNQMRTQVEEETTLARNKADEYASTTRSQAQEFLRSRTEEAETFHETRTKAATTETTALRAEAEEAAENVRRAATEAAATMRREAEEESVAMVRAAEEEAAQLRAKAHAESEEAKTATAELRAGAAELSARLKEQAKADAEIAAIELRNEARLMIIEAKTLRERILADLVKRRRIARQQLDQARAARDRLARSLEEVRRKLDEATGELEMAVPEARAAMDRVGTVGNEADDPVEVAALIKALDHPRPDRDDLDTLEPLPEKPDEPAAESFDLANDGVAVSETEFDAVPLEEVPVTAEAEEAESDEVEIDEVAAEEVEEAEDEQVETDEAVETDEVEAETQDDDVEGDDVAVEEDEEPQPIRSLFAGKADAEVPPPAESEVIEEAPMASIFGTPETADDIAQITEDDEVVEIAVDDSAEEDAGEGDTGEEDAEEHDSGEGLFGLPLGQTEPEPEPEQEPEPEPEPEVAEQEEAEPEVAEVQEEEVQEESEPEPDPEPEPEPDESTMTKAERRKAWKSKRQAATGGLFGLPAEAAAEVDESSHQDVEITAAQGDGIFREPAPAPMATAETPAPFDARESALVRIGPDLRRRMKRALADDQSEVLDGLRRGKRKLTVKDLPDPEGSRLRFAKALETPLRQSAAAGAKSLGGRVDESVVEPLVERVSRSVMENVRNRVWESVTQTGGGREEVLEPIRSHYRDIRAAELPALAEEALVEAFAVGVYESVPEGTTVNWVLDPSEPTADPDCIDNAQTSPVSKPSSFASGHQLPPCGERCRCLVLPAT